MKQDLEGVKKFLNSRAASLPAALFGKPLEPKERKKRLDAIVERMAEDGEKKKDIDSSLEIWNELDDRHFQISEMIFWEARI